MILKLLGLTFELTTTPNSVSTKLRFAIHFLNILRFFSDCKFSPPQVTGNIQRSIPCTNTPKTDILEEIIWINFWSLNVVEPLLAGIVLGLVFITLSGLFVAAYLQYKRGNQVGL